MGQRSLCAGQGFSSPASALRTAILGSIIYMTGDCPVLCRRFSSISGQYSLDSSSTPTSNHNNKKCLNCLVSPEEQNRPPLEPLVQAKQFCLPAWRQGVKELTFRF